MADNTLDLLMKNISNANPAITGSQLQQSNGLGQLFSTANNPNTLEYLAKGNESSAPGLAMFQRTLGAASMDRNSAAEAEQKKLLITALADRVQKRDYAGAASIYTQLDPEGAKTFIPQLMGNDPNLQGQLSLGKRTGDLEAETRYGSNPRQLKLLDLERQKAADEGKLSGKQNTFAQVQSNKILSSQFFKDYQNVQGKQAQIDAFSANPSAFGDIANVFAFMKTIDPASVVRESEFATAEQAGSLVQRAQNMLTKVESGKRLTPEQRQDLVNAAKHVVASYRQRYAEAVEPTYKQAEKQGIDPSLIDPYYEEVSSARQQKASKKGKSESSFTPDQESGIERVMKANNIDRNTAINALKQAGKLK